MSWSLQVKRSRDENGRLKPGGDLVLTGASLSTVTNEQKLVQDLTHWILEHMGDDPLHPGYGSTLDGGITPDGRVVDSVIGKQNYGLIRMEIEAEIRRIATAYQRMQIDRATRDRSRYNKSTLTGGEILAAVTDIAFEQNADALKVTITIQSARNNAATINLALPAVITTS